MKLTQIARQTIKSIFEDKEFQLDAETKKKFSKKRACFVTLTKGGELRGCIGTLEAHQELWRDVQKNAVAAAFQDPRFPPLERSELNKIKIEVSVLSKPKRLKFKTADELLKSLSRRMGIILKKGYYYSATFLPQVWETIPNKILFLEQLSLKAGLDKNAWKNSEIWYYIVEVEKE